MKFKNPAVRRKIIRILFITVLISLIAAILVGTALAAAAPPKPKKVVKKGNSKKPSEKPPDPACGMNPYLWNYTGSHYQRRFSKYCYAVNGDPNEKAYHGKWCNETPLFWAGLCTVPPPP